ncbi:GNAT family N-acetyltransferase [Aureispira anguillae]|uniref:GNAT family N-acetyltransferase n=1 Tax=Aureispira anguillae TaxID=2864201 RepID=A0A915YKF3_9BACT|nr:GNAT family N-acetyltransferase [Aureispira anguillae]BDS14849.1 GNAT family N-acetyltransferase [Aureispira anguillae]
MHISNLSNTNLEDIVFAILMAFDGYFVTMPSDVAYWSNRFQCARVDWEYSYGMFDKDNNLIGFIINGIDYIGGDLVAFNTGTGVISKYRGQRIVDQLYQYALPLLKIRGISICALEVIQKNDRAVHVYKRIGFSIAKSYRCFKGKLPLSLYQTSIKAVDLETIKTAPQHFYAWDNVNAALLKASKGIYECYEVLNKGETVGFFVVNPISGHLPQFEIYNTQEPKHWALIFDGIAQCTRNVSINNVNAQRTVLVEQLEALNLTNSINQYEMELRIG